MPVAVVSLKFYLLVTVAFCSAISCALGDGLRAYKDRVFTEFFQRTNGWIAGDGGFSVPLSDGSVLWLFGDSYVNDYDAASRTVPCFFNTRNAALLQRKNDGQSPRTFIGHRSGFKSFFKNSDDDHVWFWPGAGFQSGDRVFVYLNDLKKVGEGQWGFAGAGRDYLAEIKFPEMKIAAYRPLPDFNGISFGAGFVADKKTGWMYAFGNRGNGVAGDAFVARLKAGEPDRHWKFWNGQGWTTNAATAAVIAKGTSSSIFVCKVKDDYLLVTTAFSVACDQGREIFAATSASPTGPFSPLKKIWTLDDTVDGHFPFFYMAIAHPEFINKKNELLITYSINGYEPCVPNCVNGRFNPNYYRPRAIRVPLRYIDDGGFANGCNVLDNPNAATIIEWPGNYHADGCRFSFQDGHSEIHAWKGGTIRNKPIKYNDYLQGGGAVPAGDSTADLIWLANVTTVKN